MADYTISLAITATDDASPALERVEGSLNELDTAAAGLTNLDSAGTDLTELGTAAAGIDANVDRAVGSLNNLDNAATRAGTAAESAGNKTSTAGRAFGGLSNDLQGVIAGFGLLEVASKVGELAELGTAVNNASLNFQALNGGAAGANATLEAMRASTGGIVDDLTLMEGANRLLLMGLAANGDQAAELTQIAVTLGRAMGTDAATAIQDFSLLLSNNSVLRLDNFGIASGRVRERMEELKAAGMDASEAFTMATLEQGRIALERLGQSAGPAATALDRFGASASNFIQDVGSNFMTSVSGLAGIAEIALGQNPIQIAQREQLERGAQQFATDYQAVMSNYLDMAGLDMTDIAGEPTFVRDFLDEAYRLAAENPNFSPEEIAVRALGNINALVAQTDSDTFAEAFAATFSLANAESAITAENAAAAKRIMDNAIAGAAAGGGDEPFRGMGASFGVNEDAQEYIQRLAEAEAAAAELERNRQNAARETQGIYNDLFNLQMTAGSAAGLNMAQMGGMAPEEIAAAMPDFMEQGAAETINQQFEQAQQHLERMQELASQGLIDESEVTNAQLITDQLGAMADQANIAADAFKNITLSQALGQEGGGLMGELTDKLIQQMQDSGASEEDIAATQQKLDLQSGRETASSVALEEQLLPLMESVAAQLGPDAVALAMQNVDTFLKQAALQGLSQEQIAAMLPQAAGFAMDESGKVTEAIPSFMQPFGTVTGAMPGDGAVLGSPLLGPMLPGQPGGIPGAFGMLPGAVPTQPGAAGAAAAGDPTGLGGMKTDMQAMLDMTKQIQTAIASIGGTRRITLDLGVNDPLGVMPLIKSIMGGTSLEAIVQENGGAVPGTNGRNVNGR